MMLVHQQISRIEPRSGICASKRYPVFIGSVAQQVVLTVFSLTFASDMFICKRNGRKNPILQKQRGADSILK